MTEALTSGKKAWLTRLQNKGIVTTNSTSPVVPQAPSQSPSIPSKWTLDKADQRYSYFEDGDYYLTYLKLSPEPIKVPGDLHRKMHAAYSNWTGNEKTAAQICEEFSFPIQWFAEYKDVHKWTHDQAPLTKEELVRKDTGILVDQLLAAKKTEIKDKFYKQSDRDTKSAAEKWINYESSVLSYIELVLKSHKPYLIPKLAIQEAEEPYCLVQPAMDLHYGKGSWLDETGESYTREECRNLVYIHVTHLLSRVLKNGRPDKIVVPIGSDWFHIDNPQGSTTAGTRQDMEGTPGLILKEGMELAVEYIDMLREVAPVELIMCAGNHDEHSSIALLMFLYAWYRNCDDVEVQLSLKPRNYTTYSSTLLAFSHGDFTSPQVIAKLIPHEARNLWGSLQHTALFTGHLHYEKSTEDSGVSTYQAPSLASSDRWHNKKGYVLSRRALVGYIIYATDGPGGVVISPHVSKPTNFGFKKSGYQKKR